MNNLYWAQGIAFAVVLVAFYWGVRILAHVLQRLLYHLYLDVLDRLLGAFFAFLKGCLILGLALLLLGVFLPKNSHLVQGVPPAAAPDRACQAHPGSTASGLQGAGPGIFSVRCRSPGRKNRRPAVTKVKVKTSKQHRVAEER